MQFFESSLLKFATISHLGDYAWVYCSLALQYIEIAILNVLFFPALSFNLLCLAVKACSEKTGKGGVFYMILHTVVK